MLRLITTQSDKGTKALQITYCLFHYCIFSGSSIRPFKDLLQSRREEAQRSVLVQVQSEQSCGDLLEYCSDFGGVRSMYHYQTPKNIHFVLVEMDNYSSAQQVLDHATHMDKNQAIPTLSPFLWFKMSKKKGEKKLKTTIHEIHKGNLLESISKEKLMKTMTTAKNVSHQIEILKTKTEINELSTRLRFLTARQIELGLNGLFKNLLAYPFGSSVNGFGRNGCDLDLVLVFPEASANESRLVFHAKACSADDRLQLQNHIEVIGDLMNCYMPGCAGVKKITQARVPIIKYRQELTLLDCDLSLYNASCLQMSEVLYLLGSLDTRVKELVVTVRMWAKETGLTNPTPGRWISNFSLTLLVLFFLQQPEMKILPALKGLRYRQFLMTSQEFKSFAENLASRKADTTWTSEELLLKFFQFYAAHDFSSLGLNLLSGKTVIKPDYSAMFIVNPIQPELNVSKNVSPEETERLRAEMRNAAWQLEVSGQCNPQSGESWGLCKLLEGNLQSQAIAQNFHRGRYRLVDVKSLFDG